MTGGVRKAPPVGGASGTALAKAVAVATQMDGQPSWRCPCGGARWYEGGRFAGQLKTSVHASGCDYHAAEDEGHVAVPLTDAQRPCPASAPDSRAGGGTDG